MRMKMMNEKERKVAEDFEALADAIAEALNKARLRDRWSMFQIFNCLQGMCFEFAFHHTHTGNREIARVFLSQYQQYSRDMINALIKDGFKKVKR